MVPYLSINNKVMVHVLAKTNAVYIFCMLDLHLFTVNEIYSVHMRFNTYLFSLKFHLFLKVKHLPILHSAVSCQHCS